jgi:hypothetical protein
MSKRAANTGWVCPTCGRRFARINQGHVCEIWSVEDLLRDAPPESIILYQRFVALVTACGTFDYSVTKANIGFRGSRRLFAGVLPTAGGLNGFLDLMHQVNDRRFRTVSPYTKRLFVHIFHITSETQLDEEFAEWVREAYAVGQGFHLH